MKIGKLIVDNVVTTWCGGSGEKTLRGVSIEDEPEMERIEIHDKKTANDLADWLKMKIKEGAFDD